MAVPRTQPRRTWLSPLEKDDRAPEPEAAPIVIDVDEARKPAEVVEQPAEAAKDKAEPEVVVNDA